MSAGEVPLLQRSQAQSQAAREVSAVLGVGQAQVGARLPGFSLAALLEGDQALCPPCHSCVPRVWEQSVLIRICGAVGFS